jgi:hypothetical protein
MNQLTQPETPERSKINHDSAHQTKAWARKLGVTPYDLHCVIDRVGNSAAAVRKEIENLRQHARDLCEREGDSRDK